MYNYKSQGPYLDFGNFNYGAVGAAIGLDEETLLRAAGAVQMATALFRYGPPVLLATEPGRGYYRGLGTPFGGEPYGDDFIDQDMINQGIDYYKNRCKDPCSTR